MDESGPAFATTFLGLSTERRTSDRTYDGLTFIWEVLLISGVSLEVSFIERKKDEQTLGKQAKVLEVPVVEGIYYLSYSDGESQKMEAIEENRQILRNKLSNQEVRKVLVKTDVSIIENQSLEVILGKLEEAYERLLPYYQATRE